MVDKNCYLDYYIFEYRNSGFVMVIIKVIHIGILSFSSIK